MTMKDKDFWQELEVLDKQHWLSESVDGKGDFSFKGNLRISGSWSGKILGDVPGSSLHLLRNSKIKGELRAESMNIEGHCSEVKIIASSLTIKEGAVIKGEIQAKTVTVEEGAKVEARFLPIEH